MLIGLQRKPEANFLSYYLDLLFCDRDTRVLLRYSDRTSIGTVSKKKVQETQFINDQTT